MTKSIHIFIVSVAFQLMFNLSPAMGIPEGLNTDEELTLRSTILICYENNYDIKIQERELDYADANVVDAKSRFMPVLNFNGSYVHTDKMIAPQNIFTGYQDENEVGLSLTDSIYDGGASIANFKQAEVGIKIQKQTLRAKKLDVEFEAKRLYYGLLLAYETERITQELVTQAEEHCRNVERKYQQGTSSRFDFLQSKVNLSLLIPELVKAKNAVRIIKAELNNLMEREINSPVNVREKLTHLP
ncbi:MAG: TolC family protein, partial [Candidatus Omnitrophica bacterium]|nr:TolC family protein [Candidatus Omnitrophota bacterium]